MPELPEVETVRRGVAPSLEGRIIASAVARRRDLRWPLPERFAERVAGRRVAAVRRRSKYILVDLEPRKSAAAETLIVHLGMSGRIAVIDGDGSTARPGDFARAAPSASAPTPTPNGAAVWEPGPHDHVIFETDAARIVYTDARRFGSMHLHDTADLAAHPLIAKLGPEPLSNAFSAESLSARFDGKTASVKAALLDQSIVAGLGNIYVCEALHRSGVRPDRAAGSLSAERLETLAAAVRAVLREAIEAGGSSLRDHRQADGSLGYFQHAFSVYGRGGEPCLRSGCGGEVRRIVQTGRSSFYCDACQV